MSLRLDGVLGILVFVSGAGWRDGGPGALSWGAFREGVRPACGWILKGLHLSSRAGRPTLRQAQLGHWMLRGLGTF